MNNNDYTHGDNANASRRTAPLPVGWEALRQAILARDRYMCRWGMLPGETGAPCMQVATDVDHIGNSDCHEPHMLRSLCGVHHDRRTAIQANDARWALYRQRPRKRPGRKHPGVL